MRVADPEDLLDQKKADCQLVFIKDSGELLHRWACAYQGSPYRRADCEAEHEEGNAEYEDLGANLEVLNDLVGGFRICRRGEGDDEDGRGDDGGDEPFSKLRPVHRVAGIVLSELDQERVFLGALAMVGMSFLDLVRIGLCSLL